eukprot:TRINITY_DN13366_c0_g2_i2.p1 TRINITY_DN13366_c0_g2~~TRINITY_DN13366_c0_g2_i2.p1  ORF type:complete len:268 (-),score=63.18 TRINITY_DN13366_c0_g2_i2:366-1169(-)
MLRSLVGSEMCIRDRFYIPQTSHTYPVYLDYGAKLPVAVVPIAITRNQQYDVAVTFDLPESDPNYQAGMFMVGVRLESESQEVVASAKRPCILRYKSTLLKWMQTVFYALPYVLGWCEQRQSFELEILESSLNPWSSPAVTARVEFDDPNVQVYSAQLHFHIKLHGLRWLMWRYFWSTAVTFVVCLAFFFMVMFGVAYLTLSLGQEEAHLDQLTSVHSTSHPQVFVGRVGEECAAASINSPGRRSKKGLRHRGGVSNETGETTLLDD